MSNSMGKMAKRKQHKKIHHKKNCRRSIFRFNFVIHLLKVSSFCYRCWSLLVVVGCCWLLLGVVGCCWLLLVVVGCCWLLLVVVGRCWLLLVVVGRCWLLLVVVGRCWF